MAKVRINWGRPEDGSEVRLFQVYNTSHNKLYVLARDAKAAMSVAYSANHIYSPSVQYTPSTSRAAYEVKHPLGEELTASWDAIQEAIAHGAEGTVHFERGKILIGNEVVVK